jgi:ATP-dependent DNA helicase PIF1
MDAQSELDALLAGTDASEDRPVPCARLIGCAGTGKSYTLATRTRENSKYGLLTATTGISAINLGGGARTLNSTLGYFDSSSMRDAFLTGSMARKVHDIAREYQWIIVEEYSMLVAEQLTILHRAVAEANRHRDVIQPLGILLVGDLAQLPPVKGAWCFDSDIWPEFASHTERLDKVWRQNGGPFLDSLNHVRSGSGRDAADILLAAGATFHTQVHTEFDGTTILPKNKMVNRYNELALSRIPGPTITVRSRRWGQQRPEWGENKYTHEWGIPPARDYKVGALVMILANRPDFSVVNGDCGHIVSYNPPSTTDGVEESFVVKMLRTGREEVITRTVRPVEEHDGPDDFHGPRIHKDDDIGAYIPEVHYRARTRKYVMGQVEYFAMNLAYASTVHKSQSLTLDRVQADFRDPFFGEPAMLYVARSRCRSLEGLRIVGSVDRFVERCNIDRRVLPWI